MPTSRQATPVSIAHLHFVQSFVHYKNGKSSSTSYLYCTRVCVYIYIERERYVYRIHVYTCFFHLPVSIDLPFPRQNWDKFEADAKDAQPLLPALAGWEDSLKTATQRSIEGMIPYTCKRPLLKETFLNTATSRDLWPGRQPADFARA